MQQLWHYTKDRASLRIITILLWYLNYQRGALHRAGNLFVQHGVFGIHAARPLFLPLPFALSSFTRDIIPSSILGNHSPLQRSLFFVKHTGLWTCLPSLRSCLPFLHAGLLSLRACLLSQRMLTNCGYISKTSFTGCRFTSPNSTRKR